MIRLEEITEVLARAKSLATYTNPWHNPSSNIYGPEIYSTEAKATEYRGFLIYERVPSACWDVVKDGVCVTQRAGMSGAKAFIDERVVGEGIEIPSKHHP